MKSCTTYYAKIYCGVSPSYGSDIEEDLLEAKIEDAKSICQKYCDEVGLGLTFTKTTFIYTGGNEPGIIVGLINYPRFPSDQTYIRTVSQKLAGILLQELKQERLTIMYPDETIMIESKEQKI